MAQRGPDPTVLKDKIKKNERRIKQLEEEKDKLLVKVNDHIEKIEDLEKEIRRLRVKNDSLKEELQNLKNEFDELKDSYKWLEEETDRKLQEKEVRVNKKINKLERRFNVSEDQLCIGQLCTNLQQNMCKLTLRDHYDKKFHKNVMCMDDYISLEIKDKAEQQEAKNRWETLKVELGWEDNLATLIAGLKNDRNEVAHRPVTQERVRSATANLQKMEELSANMAKRVDTLTNMWITTEVKLEEVQRRSVNLDVIGTRQKHKSSDSGYQS